MRTLKNLPVPQDGDDAKFPDGQIRNESNTETGTPVIRELYGDVITNIYKILRDAGITPTETEDSEDSQYQLLDALKVFSNNINDLQQLLTVDNTDINAAFDFDHLPDNYVFIGKVTENLLSSENYLINSSGSDSFAANTDLDIEASSVVMVVLNQSGSQIIGLSSLISSITEDETLHVPFGTPIIFNESKNMLYYSSGRILTDFPKSHPIEDKIKVFSNNYDLKVLEVILHKKKLICFVIDSATLLYRIFCFDESDLDTVVGEVAFPVTTSVDNQPYMYCDGQHIYFTNTKLNVNQDISDSAFGKFVFDPSALTLTGVSFFSIDSLFEKSTNVFIDPAANTLYSLLNGDLYKYDLGGGARTHLGYFNTINGVVFKFNENTYYTNGNAAVKWNY